MEKNYRNQKGQNLVNYFFERWTELLIPAGIFLMGMIISFMAGAYAFWWISLPVFLAYAVFRWKCIREKKKISYFTELENFAENFQMFYAYYGDAREAVYDAMINSKKGGYEFGRKMGKYLEGRLEESVLEEAEPKEIQLLEIGRCAMEMEVSRMHIRTSIHRFNEELREEIFYMEEIKTHFSGLAEICLLPLLSIPLIRSWAVNSLSELKGYYEGIQGLLGALLVLLLAGVVFYILDGIRFARWTRSRKEREISGEIVRFHDWILLQQNNKEVRIETLLEGFMCLAGELKQKVERLCYDYREKGSRAISEAREEELCMPYVRILEGLLLCDKVSVKQAFSYIDTERTFLMEKLKNENRKRIREMAALAKVISFLPLYCVSAFFLVIPFVMEGLGRLQAYTESFGTILY